MSTPQKRKISRRAFLVATRNVLAGYALAGAGGYVYGGLVEANWLSVEAVTVPIRGLPSAAEGLRLVQLSDFHLYPYTRLDHIRNAVALANSLRPDLITLTGDFVTHQPEAIFELAPVLAGLNARYGVYSILGNHELWTDAALVRRGLEQAGLPVLVNQGLPIQFSDGSLYLAGLDDGWSGHPDLGAALAQCPAQAPVVLMMHEPDFADTLAADPRLSLQLSGHSHGGQIRLPGWGPIVTPRYGNKYNQGLYRVRDLWLYTNRGIGLASPGIRLNCRPEVTQFTLTRA